VTKWGSASWMSPIEAGLSANASSMAEIGISNRGDAYDPTPDEAYWRLSPGFRGCGEPEYPGQLLHLSQMYSPRELQQQPLFAEVFGPQGLRHSMSIALRSRPGSPGACCSGATAGPISATGRNS
jgi:hypothetical protein